jgi:UDP-N-acetylmuramoyl-tripeptide--D-alanyl-D-alanine ligase
VRSSLPSTTTIIAIAGSVGKTTTKELLSHVLQDLSPAATPAHVNTEMGVAQWLANIGKKNPPVLIVEMGAYKKGEISLMCSIAQPTIGVLTAVGSDHLGLFGSEKAIVDANAELLAALPVTGTAFVNADSQGARSATAVARSKVVLAGRAADAYERMTDVKETEKGVSLSYNNHTFVCPLRGVHNASNIFLAIQVAKQLGISITRIAELLTTFTPLPHTFQVHMEHGIILLDDTYNASRLSMMAALEWAMDRPERPRVLLTGGVLELGQAEASIMQEIGLHAQGAVERAIFVGSKGASSFSKGFARPVEKWSRSTPRLQPGSLLLCVGRMPLSTIQRVLPSPQSTKASAA